MKITDMTRDFGHYGCRHVATSMERWQRGGRAWCTTCYTFRWGIHPVLDPLRERPE